MDDVNGNKEGKIISNGGTGGMGVIDDDLLLINKNSDNGSGGGGDHVEVVEVEKEESELNALLPPPLPSPLKGCLLKKSDKMRRSVQWNDENGNKLFEVKEFQPSEVSDSDDEDNDSCMCKIM